MESQEQNMQEQNIHSQQMLSNLQNIPTVNSIMNNHYGINTNQQIGGLSEENYDENENLNIQTEDINNEQTGGGIKKDFFFLNKKEVLE